MKIPISKIKIGKRVRKDLGDIPSLAESIRELGLIHPVSLKKDLSLIAGRRRIEAAKTLGWTEIEATVMSLNDELNLYAERDENTQRKDFTPLEALDLKRQLEPLEREEAKKRQGKPSAKLAGSESRVRVAEVTGYGHTTLTKIEKVVIAAEQEPKKYAAVVKEMNETGNVDRAYRTVLKTDVATAKNRWRETIHRLWREFSFLIGDGLLERIIQKWSVDEVEEYLGDLTQIHDRSAAAIKILREDLSEKRRIRRLK